MTFFFSIFVTAVAQDEQLTNHIIKMWPQAITAVNVRFACIKILKLYIEFIFNEAIHLLP